MRFFTDKINSLRIGWNKRHLTEDDLFRLCRRYKVKVVEMPLSVGGFYYRAMGRDYIAVDSRLTGARRLVVLFHEFGHFLFHSPDSGATANFHGIGRRTRKEQEADVFALCALIPRSWLADRPLDEIAADEGIDENMLAARVEISQRYGL